MINTTEKWKTVTHKRSEHFPHTKLKCVYIYIWVCPGNPQGKAFNFVCPVQTRSVYVPYTFPLHFGRFFWKVIRSYTFRATLPLKCEIAIRSDTFRIRSVYVPPTFRKNFAESYTFLYVPCSPSIEMWNGYTFRHVPYTFRIRSAHISAEFCKQVYVPIRSVQPSRDSVK